MLSPFNYGATIGFGSTREEIYNLIFSRFSLVVKQLTSMLFVIVMKKLKICFARVDLYRLILDIIS